MPKSTLSRATVALAAEADALDTFARELDDRAAHMRAASDELARDTSGAAHVERARAHLGGCRVAYSMAASMAREKAREARSTAAVEATQMPDPDEHDDDQEQPEPMTVRTLEALLDWLDASGNYQHAPAGSTDALADALAVLRPDCGCPYPRCPACAE